MSNFSRRAVFPLALSAMVAAAVLLPSGAPADPSACPGLYCLWTKENFEGKRLVVEKKHLTNFPNFMNNKASSLKSKVGQGDLLRLYFGKDGEGAAGEICGPGNYPMIKGEDMFSSAKVQPGQSC